MAEIGPSPFVWLQFDEQGELIAEAGDDPVVDLMKVVADPAITDLVVLSHGWQNDLPDALALYTRLWKNTCHALSAKGRDPAAFAVAGVLWPSKKFDAQYDGAEAMIVLQDAAGVRAVDDGGVGPSKVDDQRFAEGLAVLETLIGEAAEPVIAAARKAADEPDDDSAFIFFKTAKDALGYADDEEDVELRADALSFANLRDGRAQDLLSRYGIAFRVNLAPNTGKTVSLGSEVASIFAGPRSAVLWALNKLTYYTMKKRAGTVGEALSAKVLGQLVPDRALRLHLVGHSFGGRLVTASVAQLAVPANVTLASVTLLEAAYSHNGLTQGVGSFSAAVGKPKGPFTITHTHNDLACTIAYPLASRLAGQAISGLGDANDPYGSMGANGPQGIKNGIDICDPATFQLRSGSINTVLADGFIVRTAESDAHNNVYNEQCGRLLAEAICTPF